MVKRTVQSEEDFLKAGTRGCAEEELSPFSKKKAPFCSRPLLSLHYQTEKLIVGAVRRIKRKKNEVMKGLYKDYAMAGKGGRTSGGDASFFSVCRHFFALSSFSFCFPGNSVTMERRNQPSSTSSFSGEEYICRKYADG